MKVIGIELGSTRIKAVMTDENAKVIARGGYEWENRYENGYWTYSLDDVLTGLRECYAELKKDHLEKTGMTIKSVDAIGISAMMHGYLAFDKEWRLLCPFRTWRNTTTSKAAGELSAAFSFNIPERWSIAHYYQAILNGEEHIKDVAHLTTLAGYVHYMLTGENVLGAGDASGMFPLKGGRYDEKMADIFNAMIKEKGIDQDIKTLLPAVLSAGEKGGKLTKEGAGLLDPSGDLSAGAGLCPPEGDAGTGMTATNSIAPRTANVSAGTSAFLMAVLEKELDKYYPEIDMVTTPHGKPVAMVHVNNFTSEINMWADMFSEAAALFGKDIEKGRLFEGLFKESEKSDPDIGKMTGFNFLSGEPIAGVKEGRPMIIRLPGGKASLANFMKMLIYSALGALSMGIDILKKENVLIDAIVGHGGFFKTEKVGQSAMSAAAGAPVTVMENAGEGGAWGAAILALYSLCPGKSFEDFLSGIFAGSKKTVISADDAEKASFDAFMKMYKQGLAAEIAAAEVR